LEPSPKEIFENLVPQLVRYLVHYSILQANASEHSARFLAMKRAADNTKELIKDLTLKYNKLRQSEITSEVCEISLAKEVME
jgi:F-type H+-transporting ATPase subunit gamma